MSFPKMFFTSDGRTTIVNTQEEQGALSGAWFDSPMDFGLITAPSEEELAMLTTEASTGVMEATANPTSYAPNAIMMAPVSGLG